MAVDDNMLESLEELPYSDLGRLVTLSASINQISVLDPGLGLLVKMETLVLSENCFTELPSELCTCKKLKEIKIEDCPVKDNKAKKYIQQNEVKNLLKYLEKQGGGGGGGKSKGKGKGKKR